MEPPLRIRIVAARMGREVGVEAREVDAGDGDPAAAFQAPGGLVLVRQEAVEARPDERAEAGLRGIVAREVLALERAREELLRQVLRVFWTAAPPEADVDVDRTPVAAGERFVGGGAARGIDAPKVADDGRTCGGEGPLAIVSAPVLPASAAGQGGRFVHLRGAHVRKLAPSLVRFDHRPAWPAPAAPPPRLRQLHLRSRLRPPGPGAPASACRSTAATPRRPTSTRRSTRRTIRRHEVSGSSRDSTSAARPTAPSRSTACCFEGRNERTFSDRVYAFVQLQFLQDEFKAIDYLVAPGAGLGYKLVATPVTTLNVDGGLGVKFEKNPGLIAGPTPSSRRPTSSSTSSRRPPRSRRASVRSGRPRISATRSIRSPRAWPRR